MAVIAPPSSDASPALTCICRSGRRRSASLSPRRADRGLKFQVGKRRPCGCGRPSCLRAVRRSSILLPRRIDQVCHGRHVWIINRPPCSCDTRYGVESQLRVEHPDCGHDFPPEMRCGPTTSLPLLVVSHCLNPAGAAGSWPTRCLHSTCARRRSSDARCNRPRMCALQSCFKVIFVCFYLDAWPKTRRERQTSGRCERGRDTAINRNTKHPGRRNSTFNKLQ